MATPTIIVPSFSPAIPGKLIGLSAATNSTTYSTTSASLVAVDTTNMAVTFTAPSSGKALARLTAINNVTPATDDMYWGLINASGGAQVGPLFIVSALAGEVVVSAPLVLTGLTPNTSYTLQWAWKMAAGTGTIYTDPSNYPALMEVWAA